MANDDAVVTELDAEINRLHNEIQRLQAEIDQAQEFRRWWIHRHPETKTKTAPRTAVVRAVDILDSLVDDEIQLQALSLKDAVAYVTSHIGPATPAQIADALLQLGWQTESPNFVQVVRNTLHRLLQAGIIAKQGNLYLDARPRVGGSPLDVEPPVSLFAERKESADAAPS